MVKANCDALVIGAGPSGSTAAYLLASRGFTVILLDRMRFPRPKLCGGLLTWKTMRTLERVFQVTPDELRTAGVIHWQSRRYRVADSSNRCFERTLDYPFHLVDRAKYDDFWLQRAMAAGAEVHQNAMVVRIDLARTQAVSDDGSHWTGRFLIGADGVNSRVRQALMAAGDLREPSRPGAALALECFVAPRRKSFTDYPALYYGFVPWGYAWSFPGPHHQVIGIGALRHITGSRIKKSLRSLLMSLGVADPGALRVQGRGLPYGNYLDSPGHRNILLAGDAAGLADPFLGEGIYYAHRSAELAAHAAAAGRDQPESALSRYRDGFRRVILPELRYALAGRRLIFSLPPSFYFPVIRAFLRVFPKLCEETVQGQRSFRGLRRIRPAS